MLWAASASLPPSLCMLPTTSLNTTCIHSTIKATVDMQLVQFADSNVVADWLRLVAFFPGTVYPGYCATTFSCMPLVITIYNPTLTPTAEMSPCDHTVRRDASRPPSLLWPFACRLPPITASSRQATESKDRLLTRGLLLATL